MSREPKSAAIRRNGVKGGGPEIGKGPSPSSQNALTHGLSTIHRQNDFFGGEICRLADALCAGSSNSLLREQAIRIPEAQVLLRCVRAEQIAALERLLDSRARPVRGGLANLAEARARSNEFGRTLDQIHAAAEQAVQTGSSDPDPTLPLRKFWTNHQRDTVHAMRLALPALRRLQRYESRAWSLRRRAMNSFVTIQALQALQVNPALPHLHPATNKENEK
jgi:hypothetical protein